MEKIIGREEEFGKLTDYMGSGKSEFIALYGGREGRRESREGGEIKPHTNNSPKRFMVN